MKEVARPDDEIIKPDDEVITSLNAGEMDPVIIIARVLEVKKGRIRLRISDYASLVIGAGRAQWIIRRSKSKKAWDKGW